MTILEVKTKQSKYLTCSVKDYSFFSVPESIFALTYLHADWGEKSKNISRRNIYLAHTYITYEYEQTFYEQSTNVR